MIHANYWRCLLALLSSIQLSYAQQFKHTPNQIVAINTPVNLPLFAFVGQLPGESVIEQSAYHKNLVRQKVRTVTKLRIRPGMTPDTVEYSIHDQRGNTTKHYNAVSQQRTYKQFNERNQLVKTVIFHTRSRPYQQQLIVDPLQNSSEATIMRERNAPAEPYWSAKRESRSDTIIITTQLHIAPSAQLPLAQTVFHSFTHGDTTRVEVVGYDENQQALAYEAYVHTTQAGRQVTQAKLDFRRDLVTLLDTSAHARQLHSRGISDTEILVRYRRQLRGQLLVINHLTYNAEGQLVLEERFSPAPLRTKAVTRTNENSATTGVISLTTSQAESSVRNRFNKKGQLIEQQTTLWPVELNTAAPQAEKTVVTVVNTYSSKGLLLTETNSSLTAVANPKLVSPAVQYSYHYTYY